MPFLRSSPAVLALALTTCAILSACGDDGDNRAFAPAPTGASATGDVFALTASGKVVSFSRAVPGALISTNAVTGVASGETLLGIDTRPIDGKLYALGSRGTIYLVDPATGAATLKSMLVAAAGSSYTGLVGTSFAVNFNPVADRLRVIGNTGSNLRINVDTGAVIADGAITPSSGAAVVTAAAYTNAFAGTTTTQLYDLDAAAGRIYLQDPPNAGTLGAGRALGASGTTANGFDIDPRTNTGYASFSTATGSTFYSVNLATGVATSVGTIGGGEVVRAISLKPPTAPTAVGLTTDNRLVAFDPRTPNTITATVAIANLGAGENVVGIDFRPADGLLYALTANAKIYTVDPVTGGATLKSTLSADPADTTLPYTALAGTSFSVDFNPVADRMRVISATGQDLRINVDTGATTTDGDLNRATVPPTVLAAAYTNAYAGTTATVLYDLESNSDVLATQNPPNNGTLVDVGPLGLDLAGMAGFDIGGGDNGLVLAALRVGTSGPFSLYTVALATGTATLFGNTSGNAALSQIGGAGGPALRDLAIRF